MAETITYRLMREGEEASITEIVLSGFQEFIGREYSQEGRETFYRYITPDALSQRSQEHHFVLVAVDREEIVGAIEIRQNQHISLLFVKKQFHNRGIAKELFENALEIMRQENSDLKTITVNSSRYALPAYEKLGFSQIASEQVIKGIIFTPMKFELVKRTR